MLWTVHFQSGFITAKSGRTGRRCRIDLGNLADEIEVRTDECDLRAELIGLTPYVHA